MPERTFNHRQLASLALLFLGIVLLWNTPLLYPLKILVVFFHELSHGLAAVITGGSIVEIEVVKEVGGHCLTRGGSRFLTLTAGYLGSLTWGGLILIAAARTRWDRHIMGLLGLMVICVSLLYVRPFLSFGFGFGPATALGMLALAHFATEEVNDFALKVIGLTSCLYAILDIKSDVIDRVHLRSDARMLAELTGLPTLAWGILWILIAIAAAGWFLVVATKQGPPERKAS